jgi:hypothetical protein
VISAFDKLTAQVDAMSTKPRLSPSPPVQAPDFAKNPAAKKSVKLKVINHRLFED